jgi:integrase
LSSRTTPLDAFINFIVHNFDLGVTRYIAVAGGVRGIATRQSGPFISARTAALMRAIWRKHRFPSARPHDLRRSAATLIQSAVLPDRPMKWSVEEVGWLLGHRNENGGPVTLVYARYDHFDEKRAMAATLERELNRILGIAAPKARAAA